MCSVKHSWEKNLCWILDKELVLDLLTVKMAVSCPTKLDEKNRIILTKEALLQHNE